MKDSLCWILSPANSLLGDHPLSMRGIMKSIVTNPEFYYRKILDDLSAADQTLQKPANPDLLSSAAVLQAQQLQAALQQVASTSGLTNTSLLPGLLQGGTSTASSGDQISSQLSVMLPAQQQVNAHYSKTNYHQDGFKFTYI